MINNNMNSDKKEEVVDGNSTSTRPNESTGIYVRGFVKITDPESGEVIVETAN